MEAEELRVVPHVRERELAGDGGTEVLDIFNFSIIENKQLAGEFLCGNSSAILAT